jgi:hypothetical protein
LRRARRAGEACPSKGSMHLIRRPGRHDGCGGAPSDSCAWAFPPSSPIAWRRKARSMSTLCSSSSTGDAPHVWPRGSALRWNGIPGGRERPRCYRRPRATGDTVSADRARKRREGLATSASQ